MNNILFFIGMIISSILEYKIIRLIDKKERLKMAKWEQQIKNSINNDVELIDKKGVFRIYDNIKNVINNCSKYLHYRKNNM